MEERRSIPDKALARAEKYETQPGIEDFSYSLVLPKRLVSNPEGLRVYHQVLIPAIKSTRGKFGVEVTTLNEGGQLPNDGKLPYVMFGPVNPYELNDEEKEEIRKLSTIPYSRVTLISATPSRSIVDDRINGSEFIPKLERELGGVRALYPDDVWWFSRQPSVEDVLNLF